MAIYSKPPSAEYEANFDRIFRGGNMSDTPRTDAAIFKMLSSLQSGTMDVVRADLCRTLERELAEATAAAEEWYAAASPYATPSTLRDALAAFRHDIEAERRARESENDMRRAAESQRDNWKKRAEQAEARVKELNRILFSSDPSPWQEEMRKREDDLRAQLATAQKDAERYRWLRQGLQVRCQDAVNGKRYPFLYFRPGRCLVPHDSSIGANETLDAAIDAAKEGT